ncbi:uncharacterized protein CANTADRAFT_3910 [Suhomyces tanzawaensis NRRL Y-17324]|uniref:Uncharacterized protein n=1 Tax=Suhomyces tanzawaensis NRRL Y-17324 TaxID=984487 RepID=A0A1E4SQS0_9ASCO|nr:uncharacterized protein CANTADRAFT_3910 [Suhomyces tanzawaensis NRRL Y-17324]ODV81849.1 hypothetical protein CANTADRAFT_3910 [Suhomyces tanzawaensis NRRL Y-17324]
MSATPVAITNANFLSSSIYSVSTPTTVTTTSIPDNLTLSLSYNWDDDDAESIVSEDDTESFVSDGDLASSPSYTHQYPIAPVPRLHQSMRLKALMPALFKSKDCTHILTQFFSNELFFADNLCNLKDNFLNHDFKSFEAHRVLFPIGTLDPAMHEAVLAKLQIFSSLVDKLTSILASFNHSIVGVVARINSNADTKCLETLQEAKAEFNSLIDQYLSGEGLNGVIDDIIDMLYDYNLLIQENQTGSLPDPAFLKKTDEYYASIESTLKVSARIDNKDVSLFKRLLEANFIYNQEFQELVGSLMRSVEA